MHVEILQEYKYPKSIRYGYGSIFGVPVLHSAWSHFVQNHLSPHTWVAGVLCYQISTKKSKVKEFRIKISYTQLIIFCFSCTFGCCKQQKLLYICYKYSDIEVGLCLKTLVTHLTIGHVANARVILVQKITNF